MARTPQELISQTPMVGQHRPLATGMRRLETPAMRPVPQNFSAVGRQMWDGPGVEARRVGAWRPESDSLIQIPTGQEFPESAKPATPAWVVAVPPMWNAPNYRSIPFDRTFRACIPTWLEEYRIGTLEVGDMEMMVIKSISYHVISGLQQYDLFQIRFYNKGREDFQLEDMIIDPATADPSKRYIFSGQAVPFPVETRVDTKRRLSIFAKAVGVAWQDDTTNHIPGEVINPNAWIDITISGWYAKLDRDEDGAPRITDLGMERD